MQQRFVVVAAAVLVVGTICNCAGQQMDEREKRSFDFNILIRNLLQKSADVSAFKANVARTASKLPAQPAPPPPPIKRRPIPAAPPPPPPPPLATRRPRVQQPLLYKNFGFGLGGFNGVKGGPFLQGRKGAFDYAYFDYGDADVDTNPVTTTTTTKTTPRPTKRRRTTTTTTTTTTTSTTTRRPRTRVPLPLPPLGPFTGPGGYYGLPPTAGVGLKGVNRFGVRRLPKPLYDYDYLNTPTAPADDAAEEEEPAAEEEETTDEVTPPPLPATKAPPARRVQRPRARQPLPQPLPLPLPSPKRGPLLIRDNVLYQYVQRDDTSSNAGSGGDAAAAVDDSGADGAGGTDGDDAADSGAAQNADDTANGGDGGEAAALEPQQPLPPPPPPPPLLQQPQQFFTNLPQTFGGGNPFIGVGAPTGSFDFRSPFTNFRTHFGPPNYSASGL